MSESFDRTILVSLFHTEAQASAALSDLQNAGVPAQAVQTLDSAVDRAQTSLIFDSLQLPPSDTQVLSDGLAAGGRVIVVCAEDAYADKAEAVFRQHNARKIDERVTEDMATTGSAAVGEVVVPVIDEDLVVGKKTVEKGGVRVFSRMVTTPVQEEVTLREEHATIERRSVDRPISEIELAALGDRKVEVREMAEEAVVGKTARVVEEIRLEKDRTERTHQIHDTLRKTEVEVEDLSAGSASAGSGGGKGGL